MKFADRNLQVLVLAISALWMFSVGVFKASHYSIDFTPVYTGARCLLTGCDPYNPADLEKQYFANGGQEKQRPHWKRDPPVYPPSTFLVASPFTALKLPAARLIWAAISAASLIVCVGFVWLILPPFSRWIPTILGSLFLIESTNTLVPLGQPATLAISLLVIGAILYLHNRYIPLATVMLLLSLALKPQMGGLIALYFVVRKIHWRAAVLAIGGAVTILLIAGLILKAHAASSHWIPELRAGVASTEMPGAVNDPRPGQSDAIGFTNLQAITSAFTEDAKKYNAAAYGFFAVILVAWVSEIAKNDEELSNHYIAVAGLATISFLPVYHRAYDTVLLILTSPAIATIYYRRRQWLGPILVVAAILQAASASVQDYVQDFLNQHAEAQHLLHNKFLFVLLMRQQALEVLGLAILYLAAMFMSREPASREPDGSGMSHGRSESFVAAGNG